MTSKFSFILLLSQIALFATFGTTHSIKLDFKQIKAISSLKRNFDVANIISEISHIRSTENDKCSNELSAIKNGLDNLDEWAFESEWGFFD